jgi:hypothetical protein
VATSGKGKKRATTCAYSVFASVAGSVRSLEVTPAEGYRYRTKAVNSIGESGYSNQVEI